MDDEKIQEELQFLLEEDSRVVTYMFVSANFGIHVNAAKRHLQTLLGSYRSKGGDDVTATYYLSGLCDEQGDYVSQKCLVVSEDRLAAARDSLTSVTSEHVFSLQRHRVSDSTVLYGADQQERQADPAAYNSHGAITSSRAELIPEAELLKARKASLPPAEQPLKRPAPAPAPAVKKEPTTAVATEKSSETPPADQKAKANGHDKAEEEKPKSGKSSASKGSANIASMFAKASSEKKTTKSSPKKPAGGGMMSSFLKKGADQKPAPAGGDSSPAAAPAETPEKPDPPAVKAEPEDATKTVRFGAKKSTTSSGGAGKGAGRGKRPRKGDSGSARPAKQRRRIRVLASDSDSSDQEDGDRDEREEEEEPEPEAPPPPAESDEEEPKTTSQQPRRKRKLVTKTFVDEEGFMVTKKEYETCSGSESEEAPVKNGADEKEKPKSAPASASVEPPKPSKPKETSQPKVKQAGIMSFFKKK